ncbi:ATP-dependent protease ATPase subunit HslU [Diplonema papillatum]|nr:ATP-dependent protease ATPase subunit HslU [Diplonema papillatum]KAJ9462309.1 ATP-dependent protease ATPase subunit HslU [Diplonema papillatum]|eukprot:gene18479-28519_t
MAIRLRLERCLVTVRGQRRWFRKQYQLQPLMAVDESGLGPKQMLSELDTYVIGQLDAKREVSVAVRERWRRLQLPEEKAEEISPKNILVSGPSGCGKTEIIRRVSKLLHAPFVKVDASTFTRRGVVGANVTDMVVDLYDAAEDQSKAYFARMVQHIAREAAEDIVIDAIDRILRDVRARETEKLKRRQAGKPTDASATAQPPNGPVQQEQLKNMISGLQDIIRDFGSNQGGHQLVVMSDGGAAAAGADGKDDEHDGDADPPFLPFLSMLSDQESAKDSLRAYILEEENEAKTTSANLHRFAKQIMKHTVKVEQGDVEDAVVVALKKQSERSFPQMLFNAQGGDDGASDVNTMKELLKQLEERVLDALQSFRFSSIRSPVKKLVEHWGIICIDEIDKVVGKKHEGGDRWMNTDVQQELLTLVEGTKVNIESARALKSGGQLSIKVGGQGQERIIVDTTHILFVCAGAFTLVKPRDMLVELLGRLPVRVQINSLGEDDLYKILTATKYPMVEQQSDLFSTEGVTLKWTDDAIRQVARVGYLLNIETENTGARVLNSVLRAVLSELSFDADEYNGQSIEITKEYVIERTKAMFPHANLSTFVL